MHRRRGIEASARCMGKLNGYNVEAEWSHSDGQDKERYGDVYEIDRSRDIIVSFYGDVVNFGLHS